VWSIALGKRLFIIERPCSIFSCHDRPKAGWYRVQYAGSSTGSKKTPASSLEIKVGRGLYVGTLRDYQRLDKPYSGTKQLSTGIHMCPQQQPGRPGTNKVRIRNCQEKLLLGTLRSMMVSVILRTAASPNDRSFPTRAGFYDKRGSVGVPSGRRINWTSHDA
jgi:hypothetical protein